MDARALTAALSGKWHGHHGMGRCPGHDDHSPSLSIADGRDGKLLLRCFAGCSFTDIIAALRSRGILSSTGGHQEYRPDPQVERQRRNSEIRDRRRRVETARSIWRRARPIEPDDPADLYLRSRSVSPPWPPTLRIARQRVRHPTGALVTLALVAAACRWPSRDVVAVQLTALTDAGHKADLDPVRWTRGVLSGAAVRLAPWEPGKAICVTEGVEDALAIRQAVPDVVPWATTGAGMARNVALPAGAVVILVLDGDPSGRLAAIRAAEALHARGHPCRVAWLPPGADPNSILQAQDGAGSPAS